MIEVQKTFYVGKEIKADPLIKGRVLKLGDQRISKDSNEFFDLCFYHKPSKIYLTQEHFDYLIDDYDGETYNVFGHIGFSNKFKLYLSEKEGKYIFILTEIIIKG